MKRKILAITLAVTMIIGLTGCGERRRSHRSHDDATGSSISAVSFDGTEEGGEETKEDVSEVTITKVNEVDDPDEKLEMYESAVIYADGDKKILCTYKGEKTDIDITGATLEDMISAQDTINGKAVFEVRMPGDNVKSLGLYSEDGEELIPCNAAIMKQMEGSSRFIEVIYTTNKTTDEDKAIMYTTDSTFSLSPEEGDVMYEGYVRFFDLKEKRMVPIPDVTSNAELHNYRACGNSLIYDNSRNDEIIIYNANGEEIKKYNNEDMSLQVGNGIYSLDKGSETYTLYDENAKELLQKNQIICCDYDNEDYIGIKNDGKVSVCDRDGNEIIPEGDYTDFKGMYGKYIFCMEKDDKNVYIKKDGSVIYETKEYDNKLSKGVFYCKNKDEKYDVVDESGLLTVVKDSPNLAFSKKEDGETKYFVYNKKEYSSFSGIDPSTSGVLLYTQDEESGLFNLYEVEDGKRLLDGYNKFAQIDNYIYAYKDSKWEIYKVSIPEKYQTN